MVVSTLLIISSTAINN